MSGNKKKCGFCVLNATIQKEYCCISGGKYIIISKI